MERCPRLLLAFCLLALITDTFRIKSYVGPRMFGPRAPLHVRSKPKGTSHLPLARPALRSLRMSSVPIDDVEPGPAVSKRGIVDAFVREAGGKRSIQRILIAGNHTVAATTIASLRQWADMRLGDEKALEFVVMATSDEVNANAEFVRLADAYVEVPSGSNKNNHANVDLIVSIAEKERVDAVWPGWGDANENLRLAAALTAKGISFIGPTASVMAVLADKISANILAQTANVPVLPWSGDGIESALDEHGVIPKEIFDKACVLTADQATEIAVKIGYPVMIASSAGGGDKGIRKVIAPKDVRGVFEQVRGEVSAGSPIFMAQPYPADTQRLQVQIVGDERGNAVALYDRDCCSTNGGPLPSKDTYLAMLQAAEKLAKLIGYIGAGTVAYSYQPSSDKFYFLDLSPSLQVEQPVSDGLAGINLPSVLLQLAMGIPLDRIPDVNKFCGQLLASNCSEHT